MNEREQALAEIRAIAQRAGLSADDVRGALADDVRGELAPAAATTEKLPARQGPLARALAYVGGIFVLSGIAVFVGMQWQQMNSAERIIVTLGSGIAAFVLALLAHGPAKRERLVTPLFLIAAVIEPTGMFVALEEFSSGGAVQDAEIAVGIVMLCQCLLFLARTRRTAAVFAALFFAALAMAAGLSRLEVRDEVAGLVVGVSLFCFTRAVDRSRYRAIAPFWYFASSAAVLLSWYEIVEHRSAQFTCAVLAGAIVYLSTVFKSRTLLAAGCIGLLVYVGKVTGDHFADSVGWPLALILLGILMMALGAFAVRIHRRYIRAPA